MALSSLSRLPQRTVLSRCPLASSCTRRVRGGRVRVTSSDDPANSGASVDAAAPVTPVKDHVTELLLQLSNQMSTMSRQLTEDRSSFQSQMSSLTSQMSSVQSQMSSVQSQMSSVQSQMSSVESQMSSVESQMSSTQSQMSSVQSQLNRISGQMGSIFEDSVRTEAAKLFGEAYVKPLLAQCLYDVARLLPEAAIEAHEARTLLVDALARDMQSFNIPLGILRRLQSKCMARDGCDYKWAKADEEGNYVHLGRFIASCPDQALARVLSTLKKYLELNGPDQQDRQIELLKRCEGPGVMCLIALSLPTSFMPLPEGCELPQDGPTMLSADLSFPAGAQLPGGATLPAAAKASIGEVTLPAGVMLPSGTVLPGGALIPAGSVVPEDMQLPARTQLPPNWRLPAGAKLSPELKPIFGVDLQPAGKVLPAKTRLDSGMVLPANATLPGDTFFPAGTSLPGGASLPAKAKLHEGVALPALTVMPAGTVVHRGTTPPAEWFRPRQLPSLFPSKAIEWDMRGNVTLRPDWCVIDIGEAKTQLRIADAIEQLWLRIAVLRHLASRYAEQLGWAVPPASFICIGRLLVPKSQVTAQDVEECNGEEIARAEYGFSLHVQRL